MSELGEIGNTRSPSILPSCLLPLTIRRASFIVLGLS
jgi:hypothetical protein